jgi:hypothetical protein
MKGKLALVTLLSVTIRQPTQGPTAISEPLCSSWASELSAHDVDHQALVGCPSLRRLRSKEALVERHEATGW